MSSSPSSTIHTANSTRLVRGELDAVGECLATEDVAHLADRELAGGQKGVREFRDGVNSEEWAVSDLAEQLLRARKP